MRPLSLPQSPLSLQLFGMNDKKNNNAYIEYSDGSQESVHSLKPGQTHSDMWFICGTTTGTTTVNARFLQQYDRKDNRDILDGTYELTCDDDTGNWWTWMHQ